MNVLAAGSGDLIGFVIFVVIVVLINGFRFLIQKLNQSQQQQQGRPQGEAKQWTAPQAEVRKFLQELTGQPGAESEAAPAPAPKPKRRRKRKRKPKPEPAPEAKPEPPKPVHARREPPKRRPRPKAKVSLKQLRQPKNLQTAIILREVFGPPIALKPRGPRKPNA